jgi:hypothetical protein
MAWVPVRLGGVMGCGVTRRCRVRLGYVYECRMAQPELWADRKSETVLACGWHAARLLKSGAAIKVRKLLTWTWAK